MARKRAETVGANVEHSRARNYRHVYGKTFTDFPLVHQDSSFSSCSYDAREPAESRFHQIFPQSVITTATAGSLLIICYTLL